MNQNAVTRDDWIVGGLALALLIDLLIFPWYVVTASTGFGSVTVSESFAAIKAPHAWPAVLALLALLVLLVDLALHNWLPEANVPAIGDSRRNTRLAAAVVAAAFLVIKFLLHIGDFGLGFYLAVLLTAALLYASAQASRGEPVIPARQV